MQSQLVYLDLKIKKGMIQRATFIHSNPGRAKADKTLENKTKTGGAEMEYGQKVGSKSHLRYKFHNTI